MSIELHCPKCNKLIRAPDNAGGKHGKCPYCKESVYVPMPAGDSEEIGLAPIDEEAERQAAEMRREATRQIAALGHEVGSPDAAGDKPPRSPATDAPATDAALPPGEVVDLGGEVEAFILAMRDSKLDEADQITARLEQAGKRARDFVQGLVLDEIPPPIENVPPPLAQGFLKELLSRLG